MFACMAIALYRGTAMLNVGWGGQQVAPAIPARVFGGVAVLLMAAVMTDARNIFSYGQC